jgi:hypothetical protein
MSTSTGTLDVTERKFAEAGSNVGSYHLPVLLFTYLLTCSEGYDPDYDLASNLIDFGLFSV